MRSQLSFELHPFIRPPSRSRVYLCPFRGSICGHEGLQISCGMRAYRYHVKAQHPEVDVEANCGGSQLKVNLDKADHAILSRKDSIAHYESNGRGVSPRAARSR